MNRDKKPLYRKVNTRAHGHHHSKGGEAKWDRGTKKGISKNFKNDDRRGLDYTPLFRLLLSRVGSKWDDVLKEVESRVEDESMIYWMVGIGGLHNVNDRHYVEKLGRLSSIVRTGKKSFMNKLYVDDDGMLRKVTENININELHPDCDCCTHTFNGVPFTNKWSYNSEFYNEK